LIIILFCLTLFYVYSIYDHEKDGDFFSFENKYSNIIMIFLLILIIIFIMYIYLSNQESNQVITQNINMIGGGKNVRNLFDEFEL
jgi:multisubunit Na+/H+ antiporter MnhB subunit